MHKVYRTVKYSPVKYSPRLGYYVHTELDKQGAATMQAITYEQLKHGTKQAKFEANKGWAVTSNGMDGLEVCQNVLTDA